MADNKRIPELPQIVFANPNSKIPVYDMSTDTTYYIEAQDLLPSTAPETDAWNSVTSYAIGDIRSYQGIVYVSLDDDIGGIPNLNKIPTANLGTYWAVSTASAYVPVSTSGDITLDMSLQKERRFKGNANITTNKDVFIINDTNAVKIPAFIFDCNIGIVLNWETNVYRQDWDGNWTPGNQEWTCPKTGKFIAELDYDGTNWMIKIYTTFVNS